jgi:hypothetical protein
MLCSKHVRSHGRCRLHQLQRHTTRQDVHQMQRLRLPVQHINVHDFHMLPERQPMQACLPFPVLPSNIDIVTLAMRRRCPIATQPSHVS